MPAKVVICGGGVAGAGLACALAQFQDRISVTLLEKSSEKDLGNVKRGEVIRPEVVRVLDQTGALDHVKKRNPVVRNPPVEEEVWHSERDLIGKIDYNFLVSNYPMMYLPHTLFVRSLHDVLQKADNIEVIYGAEAQSIAAAYSDRNIVGYRIENEKKSQSEEADLVVISDGGSSLLRNVLGIEVDILDYNLGYLMVILDKPSDLEYGRHCLSPEGFVGLFSMPNNLMRAAIELRSEELKEWLTFDLDQIKEKLQKRLPHIFDLNPHDIGIFYHVIRRRAKKLSRPGIVLIGDAAHTTHPMLGQGMSMVFNDVSVLSKLISANPDNFWSDNVLSLFEKKARKYSDSITENNDLTFRAFQAIGKNVDALEDFLPSLAKIGFKKA